MIGTGYCKQCGQFTLSWDSRAKAWLCLTRDCNHHEDGPRQIVFEATGPESEALKALAAKQDLPEANVLRQALRLYQGVVEGAFEVKTVDRGLRKLLENHT